MTTVEEHAPESHSSFAPPSLGTFNLFFYFYFPLFLMIYEASVFGSGLSHLACYPLLSFTHSNPTNCTTLLSSQA